MDKDRLSRFNKLRHGSEISHPNWVVFALVIGAIIFIAVLFILGFFRLRNNEKLYVESIKKRETAKAKAEKKQKSRFEYESTIKSKSPLKLQSPLQELPPKKKNTTTKVSTNKEFLSELDEPTDR